MNGLDPDDPDAPLFSVTQVARMLGVSAAVLRRWDREGLLSPERTSGGQRRYSRAQVAHLERITHVAQQQMTTAGIQRVLDMEDRIAELEQEVSASRRTEAARPRRPRRE